MLLKTGYDDKERAERLKTRKWVLFLAIFIFIVSMLFVQSLRYIKANERLKNFILTELRPVLGDSFGIEKVHLGLGTAHFRGIRLNLSGGRASLFIDDVRIGYNIFDFIIGGFNPRSLSQDVILVSPRLELVYQPKTEKSKATDAADPDQFWFESKYQKELKQFSAINRLSVRDGTIVFKNLKKEPVQLAHDIQGLLFAHHKDSLSIRLAGKIFSSKEENLAIDGEIDFKNGYFSYLHVKLDSCQLKDQLSLFMPFDFKFRSGWLNGELTLEPYQTTPARYNLNGSIDIVSASALDARKNFDISELNLSAKIQDWNISIRSALAKINGADFEISGGLKDVLSPSLDLQLKSRSIALSKFARLINKDLNEKLFGRASALINIRGPLKDVRLDGVLTSWRLKIYRQYISQVSVKYKLAADSLYIEQLKGNYAHHSFAVQGLVDLTSKQRNVEGTFTAKGDLFPVLTKFATNGVSACTSWVEADISGKLSNPTFIGNLGFRLYYDKADSITSRAAFVLHDGIASITSVGGNGSPKISGRIHLKKKTPTFDLSVSRIDRILLALFKVPQKKYVGNTVGLSFRLKGDLQNFELDTQIDKLDRGRFEWQFAAVNAAFSRTKKDLSCQGNLTLYPQSPRPFVGQFRIQKDERGWSLTDLSFYDFLRAQAQFAQLDDGDKSINGELRIDQLPLSLLLGKPDSTVTGRIKGEMIVSGSSNSPVISGNFDFNDLFGNNGLYYNTELAFSYDSLGFNLEKFVLNSPQSTLLYTTGVYDTKSDSFDVSIKGAGFDICDITHAIRRTTCAISGQSFVDLHLSGALNHPEISGIVAVKNGRFFKLPFDELELRLAKKELDPLLSIPISRPELYFSKIKLVRKGEFILLGSGSYPFNPTDSLHLTLEGKGNFLSLLTNVEKYFRKTSSSGIITAKLTGTPEKPALEDAYFSFQNGQMEFASVVPPVTELVGEVRYEPENRFVHVIRLEGKMGGEWFRISNTLAKPGMAERPIENLTFGENGLNFGVLVLESGEQGVPLNIKGLMEPGVYGRLELLGKTPQEKFYFAGPYNRPLMRGRINLHDFKFMFPFDEQGGRPNEVVANVLRSIEWDIFVKPINDVLYIKTLPGALDNVYVNLQLDEKYGGLDFSGQLADKSFRIDGMARSTSGIIEYLDMEFRVERAGVEFDRSNLIPVVYGRARTTVTDSLGIASQVFLTMQTVDETMDKKPVDDIVRQENSRARWNKIRFKLSTDNPNLGTTEAQILASLGYSTASLRHKVVDALGISTENLIFRPLYRPVERKLEQLLGFDYVRFSSRFTSNFLALNLNYNPELKTRLALLRSTKLILGKYLSPQLFLQYTGQVETGIAYRYQQREVGLRHTLGLDYRISPQLLLELEYDYNSLITKNKDDKRILLRHWFSF